MEDFVQGCIDDFAEVFFTLYRYLMQVVLYNKIVVFMPKKNIFVL